MRMLASRSDEISPPEFITWLRVVAVGLATFFGTVAPPFWALIPLLIADYIAGWQAAKINGTLDPELGEKGLWRKLMTVMLAMTGYLVQWLITTSPVFAMLTTSDSSMSQVLRAVSPGDGFAALLCLNQVTSILRNGVRAGVLKEPFSRWFSAHGAKPAPR